MRNHKQSKQETNFYKEHLGQLLADKKAEMIIFIASLPENFWGNIISEEEYNSLLRKFEKEEKDDNYDNRIEFIDYVDKWVKNKRQDAEGYPVPNWDD